MFSFADRRTTVRLCSFLLLLGVLLTFPSYCTSHGHSHDHHGHSHDHHGHAHDHHGHSHGHPEERPSFKYSREANVHQPAAHHHEPVKAAKSEHSHHSHSHSEPEANKRTTVELWSEALGSTLLISIAPFIILFIIPIDSSPEKQPLLKVLLSFASGGLLGDAFLHLIPHALMAHSSSEDGSHSHSHGHSHGDGESHSHDTSVGMWVLGGIIAFLAVEKFVRIVKGSHGHSHGHSHAEPAPSKEEEKKTKKDKTSGKEKTKKDESAVAQTGEIKIAAYLNLVADFTHNFTDGLAIGASFLAGRNTGIVTTITVLLHEIPHEIGDFAILIQSGCDRKKAIFMQLITAVGALTGCSVSLLAQGMDPAAIAWILPFTAGGFIYIATVSVIPELLENSKFSQSVKEIIALICGVYMMVIIAQYE